MEIKEKLSSHLSRPKAWILASPHAGDNTQLKALAAALGWPGEVKQLAYRWHEALLRLLPHATLAGVDLSRSSPLAAPWPDLVLCAGRGSEAVSFWLRKRNPGLRIVFVGTPWSDPENFDLVIASAQYRLAAAPNVLNTALPLHDVTAGRIAADAQRWAGRLKHLPEPRIAVLVGGGSGPYVFTPGAARRLGRDAGNMARQRGGSLLVTTSPRTPAPVADALAQAIDVPHVMHRWSRDAGENPFHAFLGLAAEIVVTADSISMLSEAAATGKPVSMFDIEEGMQSMRAEEGNGAGLIPPIHWRGRNLDTTMFRLLMNHAPARWSRDLRVVHRALEASGQARWMGESHAAHPLAPQTAMSEAVARIRLLFDL